MALITSYGIHKDRNSMEGLAAYENGGKGSGNFGHSGRPGEVGGSAPSGSGGASGSSKGGEKKKYTKADQIEDDYKAGLITAGERDGLLEKAKADGTSSDEVERPKKETTKSKPQSSKKSQESATEWAKKNLDYPEDLSGKDFDFDEVIARMTDGENFYEFFGQIDSVDREKVFGELANRTGLDYGDVYDAWLGHPTSAAISYTHSLTQSPRMRDLEKREQEGWDAWASTRTKNPMVLSEKERDEKACRDMVTSVYAYHGNKDDNKYLQGEGRYPALSKKERQKVIDDEWKYLSDNCEAVFSGNDSEGLSYNRLVYRPSQRKNVKKNSLENILVETIDRILNGGKGSGNFGHSGRPGEVGGSAPSGSHSGSSGRTKEELQDRIEDLNTRISQAGVAQKKGEKVDEGYIQDMMEERKALRAELDSTKSQPKADEDENLPSSYTGKNVSLEYKAGDHQHRPTHWTTTPEDTGYGEFVELGDGKIGVKTTMSAEDTHDSIKALFETGLAKYDEPRAKADGFLDSDSNLKVSESTMDEYDRASKHLADTAQTLEKYIKDVQAHSTASHARGTKPGSIEEKMKQAKSLTEQWGKKLKSNPEMTKEAMAKYERRADAIAKSYETISKIADRTMEYQTGMGSGSYRTHDVTADFDRPMTRAMAEREMKDMRAR